MNYQQQTLAGLNGIELIIALYDGMVRFLYRAIEESRQAMRMPGAGRSSASSTS